MTSYTDYTDFTNPIKLRRKQRRRPHPKPHRKPRNPDLYLRVRRPRVYHRFVRKRGTAFLRELLRGALALWHFASTEATELASGLWLLTWGLIMLIPGDAFNASHGYDAMRVVPEWLWAMAAMTIGSCQAIAVLYGCYGCVCKRRSMAQCSLSFYLLLTGMFVFGRWPISVAFYGGQTLAAGWVLWRLAGRRCK